MVICISFIHHNFLRQLVVWFPGLDRDNILDFIIIYALDKGMLPRGLT